MVIGQNYFSLPESPIAIEEIVTAIVDVQPTESVPAVDITEKVYSTYKIYNS